MRKLALGLVALVLLLALAAVIVTVALDRLVAANREAILARVQAALGRPVRVARITVRVRAALSIVLTEVEVGEDPEFGREPFLRAAEVTAELRLMPLLQRRLEVGHVAIVLPTIRFVSIDGRRNIDSLGRQSQLAPLAETPATVRLVADREGSPTTEPPFALVIESAVVRDGTLIAVDRGPAVESTTTIRHVDLGVRDFGRARPIPLQIDAALGDEPPSVHLAGSVGPATDRTRIPLILHGSVGPFANLHVTVDGLDIQALVTDHSLELERVRGNAAGGSFAFSGAVALSSDGPLHLAGEIAGVSLAQLQVLRGAASVHPIEGTGSLRIDLSGRVGSRLLESLAGRVAVEATHGTIHDFNLVDELLTKLSHLPGLAQALSHHLKPKYGRLLNATDTRFERLAATLRLADGRAETDDLTLAGEDFGAHAAGTVALTREVNLHGMVLMSKRFSDDVVADVKEVRYVVDDQGQLAIPFVLRGQLGQAKPKPDPAYIDQLIERALQRGAADKLVDKLFGGKHHGKPESAPPDAGGVLERKLRDLIGR
ncbi:MAG: AsmA family protein [Deltaproteobacteria bacterium]|nr:AsmA family protein [Deltaproteobacteria bacterium]MBI3387848.1 AsmA family protein [Deltaproteobacteria bacterium]